MTLCLQSFTIALTTKKVDCLKAIGKDKVTVMLQYKNFKFNRKVAFIGYIECRMIDYWKSHNDSFSNVCEDLDSYDGFLDGNRIYPMDELDDLLYDKKPSEVLQMVDTDNFNYNDDFFYYDEIYGIRSTNEKDYSNYVDYSDVFEKLINDYNQVFSRKYGHTYYELFEDVYYITKWDENEIQDYLNDDYYDYLFVNNNDFFDDDDLDR